MSLNQAQNEDEAQIYSKLKEALIDCYISIIHGLPNITNN